MKDHLKTLNDGKEISGITYATIKHGKVKVPIGSKQQRYLEYKNLPYSIVNVKNGKKTIKRMNTK